MRWTGQRRTAATRHNRGSHNCLPPRRQSARHRQHQRLGRRQRRAPLWGDRNPRQGNNVRCDRSRSPVRPVNAATSAWADGPRPLIRVDGCELASNPRRVQCRASTPTTGTEEPARGAGGCTGNRSRDPLRAPLPLPAAGAAEIRTTHQSEIAGWYDGHKQRAATRRGMIREDTAEEQRDDEHNTPGARENLWFPAVTSEVLRPWPRQGDHG